MTRNTYDSELQWQQCSEFQNQFRSYASSWAPANNLLDVGNDTLFISGAYSHATRIVDLVINETGERLKWSPCLIISSGLTHLHMGIVISPWRNKKPCIICARLNSASMSAGARLQALHYIACNVPAVCTPDCSVWTVHLTSFLVSQWALQTLSPSIILSSAGPMRRCRLQPLRPPAQACFH